jgi:hypothetical protein
MSWNSTDTDKTNFQLSSAVKRQALDIYKNQRDDSITTVTKWFDLEYAKSLKIIPDLGTGASKKRKHWSEAERLWDDLEFVGSHVAKHHKSSDAEYTKSKCAAVEETEAIETIDAAKPIAAAEKTPPKPGLTKPPIRTPKSTEISMEASQEFPNWYVQRVPRKSKGADFYYYSPQLKIKFRSRPEVRRFMDILKVKGNEADALLDYNKSFSKSSCKNVPQPTKEINADDNRSSLENNTGSTVVSSTPIRKPSSLSASLDEISCKILKDDEVYAAWWKNKKQKSPVFYPGRVLSVKSLKGSDDSCSRVYDVRFDDGDKLYDIEESFVIPKNEYLNNSLKHVYSIGDSVYSAWWPAKNRSKIAPSWYPGTIKGRRMLPGGCYGPIVLYDILFNDGDEHFNVDE